MAEQAQAWVRLERLAQSPFQANAGFVSMLHPELFARITSDEPDETIEVQPRGAMLAARCVNEPVSWIAGQAPAEEMAAIRSQAQTAPPDTDLLIVIGGAAGLALQPCLALMKRKANLHILLIEPGAARLRLTLSTIDLRDALASGRVHLSVSSLDHDSLFRLIDEFNLWRASQPHFMISPGMRHRIDAETFQTEFQTRKHNARQIRESHLETLNGRPRNDQSVKSVLLIDCWPGAPQQVHIKALSKALSERCIQHEVLPLQGYRFDLHEDEYKAQIEHSLLDACERIQPELIVSYAYHAPRIVRREVYEALWARWIQVVSNIAYFDEDYNPGECAALIDRRLAPWYKKRGAPQTIFVPIMADYVEESPISSDGSEPIVFVGNSLGLSAAERNSLLGQWKGNERLHAYVLDAERELSDFDAGHNLYDYLEANPVPDIETPRDEYAVFRYLLCQSTAARRVALLEHLAQSGLSVYGNWRHSLVPDSPLHGCLKGPLPIKREREVFARGRLFVNIHSTGHVTGPNMRFFNAPGMGGALLSDGDFGAYLTPGEEWLQYSSLDELADRAQQALSNPDELEAIREQGRQRIAKDWTYSNWLDRVSREMKFEWQP